MTRGRKLLIGVGVTTGIFVLGATNHHAPKADKTVPAFTQPADAVNHIRDDLTNAITTTGNRVAKLKPKPAFVKPKPLSLQARHDRGDFFCGASDNTKQENSWCDQMEAKTDTPASHDCSTEASVMALVAALSGDVQTAAGAAKIAGQTAGTGQKC